MGLDISTLGRTQYILHEQCQHDPALLEEFNNLKAASKTIASNTEPAMVKKMRRDLKEAARRV